MLFKRAFTAYRISRPCRILLDLSTFPVFYRLSFGLMGSIHCVMQCETISGPSTPLYRGICSLSLVGDAILQKTQKPTFSLLLFSLRLNIVLYSSLANPLFLEVWREELGGITGCPLVSLGQSIASRFVEQYLVQSSRKQVDAIFLFSIAMPKL